MKRGRPPQAHRRKGLTNEQRQTLALCGERHDTPELSIALIYQAAWETPHREEAAARALIEHAHRAMMGKDADFFRRLADALDDVKGRNLSGGDIKAAHPGDLKLMEDILDLWKEGRRTTAEFKKSLLASGYETGTGQWKRMKEIIKELCPKVKSIKGAPTKKKGK